MTSGRDLRIDFFRGLALIFIFWDHIPHNPLGEVTLRNFGLADAAEMFVFLAGFSAVLAYGKIAQRDGYTVASARILRRCWTLYVVHIFLLVLLMGIMFFANEHVETRDLVQDMGLGYFVDNPQKALVDELLLRFKPNLMDPLPLYIALLFGLPALLPLLLRRPLLALAVSLALYLPATFLGWNLSNEGGGTWYFNPFAWQLLFVIGGLAARYSGQPAKPQSRPLLRQPLFVLCLGYLAVCLLMALNWRWPALGFGLLTGDEMALMKFGPGKTNLSPLRLGHFLALAYCSACLLPRGPWVEQRLCQPLCSMGRHSLEVFCLGVLLAPLADIGNALCGDHPMAQHTTALLAVALMVALAAWLDFYKRLGKAPPVAPSTGQMLTELKAHG
ncbi:OpgC family protein [Pseudomonas typographi]|uniref:OpgC family protein n=1 Tax=Pseudomonas typographi TaxID=2715964 RepID=UPI00168761F5|nr:OpgC domain-containing protein [Pseudomonas typographi]MBD1554883.1 OpgC domain-containing protein [Pseudomonas typographi]